MVTLHPATSFWSENGDRLVGAVLSVVIAALIIYALDRLIVRRALRIAREHGDMTPQLDTRLRFLRRLVYALILAIGILSALGQFTGLRSLAASILASGAIAAAIVGFAARQVLANVVAGIMLAVTQPIRIGDWVTVEGELGVVEDVRLNYTVLRTPAQRRVIVPNERLAGGILRNESLIDSLVSAEAAIWLAPHVDTDAALKALREEIGATIAVAEVNPEGFVRLAVAGGRVPPSERAAVEADLRERCLSRLHRDRSLSP